MVSGAFLASTSRDAGRRETTMTPRGLAHVEARARADDLLARAERERLAAQARAGRTATADEQRPARSRALRRETAAAVVLLVMAFVLAATL
jgi:hypothetical protein